MHDPLLIDHLAGIWQLGGSRAARRHGRDRVVPYVFPTPGMLAGLAIRSPAAVHGRAGRFCYDTMTLVGPGSWEAIKGSADAALTAADLVGSGAPVAYALCLPLGHHSTRDAYGGSCYLNNAAIAAQALRVAGAQRVAIIDIDAHHGNGPRRSLSPRRISTARCTDPGAGWFPHYAGMRTGAGAGGAATATCRWRPAPRTTAGSPPSMPCVLRSRCGRRGRGGVAGAGRRPGDPESPLRVTESGYRAAGRQSRLSARRCSSRKAGMTWPRWRLWPSRRSREPPRARTGSCAGQARAAVPASCSLIMSRAAWMFSTEFA